MAVLPMGRFGWFCLGVFLLTGCGTHHNIPARPAESTPLTPANQLGETVVLPHLEGTITPGVNYVFCVTFQLAWNELAKDTVNSAIQLENGPLWIDSLNQGRHAPSRLSHDCYLSLGTREK